MKAFTVASLLHCFILQWLSKLWDLLFELCVCLQIYMLKFNTVISKSSTYKTMIIRWPSFYCKYTFIYDLHLLKFCERRKASILEYHSLGPVLTRIVTSFVNQIWISDVSLRMIHVYLLMNISMHKGWLNIHVMHFPVLGC